MKKNILPFMMGSGLILVTVHNLDQPLLNLIALPTVGLLMIAVPIIILMPDYVNEAKIRFIPLFSLVKQNPSKPLFKTDVIKQDLGPKVVYIPLLIIAALIAISGLVNGTPANLTVSGLLLFGIYMYARHEGSKIFVPMAWAVVIFTIGMIWWQFGHAGVKTGGWISPTNYDMATGLLLFAAVVSVGKSQWILTAFAVVGLFFTGADEALFAMGVLVLYIIVRRDFSRKILLPVGALVITLAICTPLGITQSLWFPAVEKVASMKEAIEETKVGRITDTIIPNIITDTIERAKPEVVVRKSNAFPDSPDSEVVVSPELLDIPQYYMNIATGYRWLEYWSISPIRPVGYGYNINTFYYGIPHNVVLIIIEQIGIIGALAWLWLVGYGLFKTKWKYAWLAVIALSLPDHFMWTQFSVAFPALIGVSTLPFNGKDLIYKGD